MQDGKFNEIFYHVLFIITKAKGSLKVEKSQKPKLSPKAASLKILIISSFQAFYANRSLHFRSFWQKSGRNISASPVVESNYFT